MKYKMISALIIAGVLLYFGCKKDAVVETTQKPPTVPLGWFTFPVTPDSSLQRLIRSPYVRVLDSSLVHSFVVDGSTDTTTTRVNIFFGPLPPSQGEYSPTQVREYLKTFGLVPASWQDLNGFIGEYHHRLKWQAYNFAFHDIRLRTTIPINGDNTIGILRLLTQTGPTPLYLGCGNSRGPTDFFYSVAAKLPKK